MGKENKRVMRKWYGIAKYVFQNKRDLLFFLNYYFKIYVIEIFLNGFLKYSFKINLKIENFPKRNAVIESYNEVKKKTDLKWNNFQLKLARYANKTETKQ